MSMSSVTPAGLNAYQVNLNRTKTKKWVEAKAQNYDGDDWGVDEYGDEDEDEDETESTSAPAMMRPTTHFTGSRNASLPSLQSQRPAAGFEFPGRRTQSVQATEEAVQKRSLSSDLSAPRSTSSFRHLKSDSIGKEDNFNVTSPRDPTEYTDADGDAGDQRRQSTSPKIPDMARMSAFRPDLFPPNRKALSIRKAVGGTVPENPPPSAGNQSGKVVLSGSHSEIVSAAGQTLSAKPVQNQHGVDGDSATTQVFSPLPSKIDSPVGVASTTPSKDHVSFLHHDVANRTIAPLRTPSPRASLPSTHEASLPGGGFDTGSSSPVKDNDVLSDEILKSLSSSATPAETLDHQPTSKGFSLSEHVGTGDSNFTLQDQHVSTSHTELSPTEQPSEWLAPPQSSPTVRHRFSWEVEDRVAPAHAQQEPLLTADLSTASSGETVDENQQTLSAAGAHSHTGDAASLASETPRAAGISPQASISSSQPAVRQEAAPGALDSISPDETENNTASVHVVNQSSLAGDQKALNPADSNSVSSTPLSENPPGVGEQFRPGPVSPAPLLTASPQSSQPQIMSLRDIMKLSSSKERIAKYNESREMLARTESGLESWLVHLSLEHPDMTPDGPPSSAQGSQQPASTPNTATQAGTINPNTNTASSPSSRSRLASLGMPNSASGSTGHPGNQIGSKGKEFMHSAGKMGKGLLSKGRSKLRGTGDKGDYSEATSQSDEPKSTKASRRASWGLMLLGMKARGEGEASPHASASADANTRANALVDASATSSAHANANASVDTEAAQQQSERAPQIPGIPVAAPLALFNPETLSENPREPKSLADDADDDVDADADAGFQPHSKQHFGRPSRATTGLSKLQIPHSSPLLSTRPQSAPLSTTAHSRHAQPAVQDPRAVMVSPDGHLDSLPAVLLQNCVDRDQSPGPEPAPVTKAEDGMTPLNDLLSEHYGSGPSHSTQQIDGSKRNSSFLGLPPIRRVSTFALTCKPPKTKPPKTKTTKARRARKRFPIDDDDEDEEDEVEEDEPIYWAHVVDTTPDEEATFQNPSQSHPSYSSQEPTILAVADIRGRGVPSPDPSTKDSKDSVAVLYPETTTYPDRLSGEWDSRLQQVLAFERENTQGLALRPMVHPSQRLPASGPWRLEESKLTEPLLNPLARNRAGIDTYPPEFMYGFDKETGMISPDTVSPSQTEPSAFFESSNEPSIQQQQQTVHQSPQQPAHHRMLSSASPPPSSRQRSDIPPSSAQRWPELFACSPDQRPLSQSSRNGNQPYQTHPPCQPWLAQHNESAGQGAVPSSDERGRTNRASGLLKDLGQRLTRPNSREHSNGPERHGDEASEASMRTGSDMRDQKGRWRTSFFPGRSSPRSVDRAGTDREAEGTHESQALPRTPPRGSRRRSIFGGGLNGKLVPSSLATSSHSNAASNVSTSSRTPSEAWNIPAKKKRFSGMAKVSNLLSRNKHADERPASSEQFRGRSLEPPAPPFQRFGRASTTNFSDTRTQHHSTDRNPERRGLRRPPSVSDLLSSMLGKRSTSLRTEQGDATGSLWQSMAQEQQDSSRPGFVTPQAMSEDPGSELPFVQNSSEVLPASIALPAVGERTNAQLSAPRDGDLSRPPTQTFLPSYLLGIIASKELGPSSSCSSSSFQQSRGHLPAQQEDGLVASQDHGPNDWVDIDGRNHTAVVSGELTRPFTVSPDLSVTSDWGIITEHRKENPDRAHNDDAGPWDGFASVILQDDEGAFPVNSHTQRTVVADHISGEALPLVPEDETLSVAHIAAGQDAGLVSHENAFVRGVASIDKTQAMVVPNTHFPQQAHPHEDMPQQQKQSQQGPPEQHACGPSGQTPAAALLVKDGVGSKWKGLTKRMSEQMTGFGQHRSSEHVPESDAKKKNSSSSNNKIFGALKRISKQQQADAPIPAPTWVDTHSHAAPLSQKQQQQTVSEPRYDQVPIPRGYHAVHGEGITVPSAYNVGRRRALDERLTAQQQQQQVSPPLSQSSLHRPDSVSSLGMVNSPWPSPPLEDRRAASHSGLRVGNPAERYVLAGLPSRDVYAPETKVQTTHDGASPQPETTNKGRPMSLEQTNDDPFHSRAASTGGPSSVSAPVPLPERSSPSETAKTKANTDTVVTTSASTAPTRAAGAAELEDTFGAHQRRTRLAGQEEKIWCDPEEDAAFRPRMTATSYPGQEWNPYEAGGVEDEI
ncbi:hypothetical protein E4U21_003298 [Claviceps maximensis]|nr:hypothetical protein E4U21_003298 [Claviceps maximensis]